MKCKLCESEILSEWRKGKTKGPLLYCSRSCSNKRVQSTDSKVKISSTLKQKIQSGEILPIPYVRLKKLVKLKTCNYCSLPFYAKRRNINTASWPTTCSDVCYLASKRRNAFGNKQIEYNGVRFDSSWEVEMVKFFENEQIKYTIPDPITWVDSDNRSHKYFPDFYLPQLLLYVDPKNPIVIIKQKAKLDIVSKQINLLYGDVKMLQSLIKNKMAIATGVEPACNPFNLSTRP